MNRILHINSTIVINSGVMRVLMNYYSNIDTSCLQFDFLYFSELKNDSLSFQKEIEDKGGRVYYIPNFTRFKEFNEKLKTLLKSCNYSIVHIHDAIICRFVYRTLKKCGVKHVIVHSHATEWSDKRLNGIRNYFICRNIDKYVDDKFACSKAAGKFLYGKKSDFYIMNNAIDTNKYAYNPKMRKEMRTSYNLNNNVVFGHVGNFVNQKNHIFLIQIFKKIHSILPNSVLVLIGDGPLRNSIKKIVSDNRVSDKVFFLGKRNNVEDYYQMMDCFILPSLYEGLPMVGVEAQCSGLPILFSNTITTEAGIAEYDFISLKSNPSVWANKAIQFVNKSIDRTKAKDYVGRKGFDIKKECERLRNKYFSMT